MFFQVMIDNVGDVFCSHFLSISMHISVGLHSLDSAKADIA